MMEPMEAIVGWGDLLLRLGCTLVAAGLIGINRGARGRPAGMRTTLLVGLAACIAMLEASFLLTTSIGKGEDSIIRFDPMRLPLGVLSGIGFIGAGAILRRGDLVRGITTAATLWMVTILGLCFGGGQIALGWIGTALTLFVLWGLIYAERHVQRGRRGILSVTVRGPIERSRLRARLEAEGYEIASEAIRDRQADRRCETRYDLRWKAERPDEDGTPDIIGNLAADPNVLEISWQPRGLEIG